MRLLACLAAASALVLPLAAQEAGKKKPARNVGGIDAKDGGTLTGIVAFSGPRIRRKKVTQIDANPFCKECHKDGLPLEDKYALGKNGDTDTVPNVLVYLSKGLEGKSFAPPTTPAVLDQIDCIYTPHVVGVMTGQVLEIHNSDEQLHNVLASPFDNKGFNHGMAKKGEVLEKTFPKPELKVKVQCILHPWMYAYVHVLEHPFFAVTDEDGTFTIRGPPPGEYEVSVLHESARMKPDAETLKVKVGAGEKKTIEFIYRDGRRK